MPVQQLKVSSIFSSKVLLAKAGEIYQHNSIIAKTSKPQKSNFKDLYNRS
jgi:hypothetical protein